MAQTIRPSADTYRDAAWTEDDGTTNALYAELDETVADDGDYIKTTAAPAGDVYVTKLTSGEDPVSSSNHVVRYRYAKSASGGAQVNLTVELREGYVSEAATGNLLANWIHNDISDTATTQQQTLAGYQADAITDYTDLYLRFVATQA